MSDPAPQYTEEDVDKMSRLEMARLWRFAPSGHPLMDSTNPLSDRFMARFKELGGFSPAISKALGWSD